MHRHQDVTEGEEVRVFDVNGKSFGWPAEGVPGRVVKAGPVLVRIEHARAHRSRDSEQVFRRETGRANDAYGHQWYKTLDELAEYTRRVAALDVLRRHRVVLERHGLPVEVIEQLAAVLTAHEGSGGQACP